MYLRLLRTGEFGPVSLLYLLKEKYNIKLILGHDEISPGRKQDPGPAFPMDKFRNEILSDERAVDKAFEPFEGKVKAVAVFKEALTDAELQCLTTI